MEPLTAEQAAAVAGITVRRLNQLRKGREGPPQCASARYDCTEFGIWLARRNAPDTFADARTRLTVAQADKTELEAKELAGELLRATDVAQVWGERKASIRAKLLPFPAKIAQRIAPPERLVEVQAEAQAVVYEVLRELAGDAAAMPGDRPADGHGLPATAGSDGEPVGGSVSNAEPRVKRRTRKVVNGNG